MREVEKENESEGDRSREESGVERERVCEIDREIMRK